MRCRRDVYSESSWGSTREGQVCLVGGTFATLASGILADLAGAVGPSVTRFRPIAARRFGDAFRVQTRRHINLRPPSQVTMSLMK